MDLQCVGNGIGEDGLYIQIVFSIVVTSVIAFVCGIWRLTLKQKGLTVDQIDNDNNSFDGTVKEVSQNKEIYIENLDDGLNFKA